MSDPRPITLLNHRPFALFWLARVAATVAFQMQTVAVAWQLYELTGNPLDLGLVGLMQFVPALLLTLFAGHAADRYDRRTIVRLCQLAEGAAVAALAASYLAGALSRELILAIVFVIGAARAFESPTLQTLLPAVVPLPMLARAVAGTASANQAATIAGPAVGGLVYALSPALVYAACCALFVAASVLIALIHVERPPAARRPSGFAAIFAGIGYIRRHPIVLGAISLDMFAVLLGGATALLPIYARDIFQVGPWGLGVLRAAPAFGALAMALFLARVPLRGRVGHIMFAAVGAYGVATIVFALSTSLALAAMALVLLGASDMISVVIRQTLVQLETPDEMRGRVSAVNALFIGTSNQLGDFRAGFMAAFLGAVPAVLIGGIGTLAVVVGGMRLFPALLAVDRLETRSVEKR